MSLARRTNYQPLAPVCLERPNGEARGFGYGAANNADRGEALLEGLGAAQGEDMVRLRSGWFAPTAEPDAPEAVGVVGAGMDRTFVATPANSDWMAMRVVHDDVYLGHLTFWRPGGRGVGYAVSNPATSPNPLPAGFDGIQRLRMDSVRVFGRYDLLMTNADSLVCSGTIVDCVFETSESTTSADLFIDLACDTGSLWELINCRMDAFNEGALLLEGAGGTVRLLGGRYSNRDASNTLIVNALAGQIEVLGADVQGPTEGEVTYLDSIAGVTPSAVGKSVLGAASAAAARTAIGAADASQPRVVQLPVGPPDAETATGDGQASFTVPPSLNGATVSSAMASVVTAGAGGVTSLQVRRVRGVSTVDVLADPAQVESGELNSTTAANPPLVNPDNGDLATGDTLLVDVDSVHNSTPARGLSLTLELTA